MIVNVITSLSKVTTKIELVGINEEEFNKAFNGESDDELDIDFLAQGSNVKLGNRLIGKVILVDSSVNEQYILNFNQE
jgi:hypothetical protein